MDDTDELKRGSQRALKASQFPGGSGALNEFKMRSDSFGADLGTSRQAGAPQRAPYGWVEKFYRESSMSQSFKKWNTVRGNSVSLSDLPARVDAKSSPRLAKVVESLAFTSLMALATLYALFGVDLRLALLPKSTDEWLMMVTAGVMGLFLLELIILSSAKTNFFLSFFFFMDVVAMLSLLPDVLPLFGIDTVDSRTGTLTVARTARVARAISRSARLARLVLLFSSVRASSSSSSPSALSWVQRRKKRGRHGSTQVADVKAVSKPPPKKDSKPRKRKNHLDKAAVDSQSDSRHQRSLSEVEMDDMTTHSHDALLDVRPSVHNLHSLQPKQTFEERTAALMESSVVGKQLEDTMLKRLFMVILAVFAATTLLAPVTDANSDLAQSSLDQVYSIRMSGEATAFSVALQVFQAANPSLLVLQLNNTDVALNTPSSSTSLHSLRDNEIKEVKCGRAATPPVTSTASCLAKFDVSSSTQRAAVLSALTTAVVTAVLMAGTVLVYGDLRGLIVTPIERLVAILKLLAIDPLATLEIKEDFTVETSFLESMLTKIGVLLQLGFGAAGASTISENLSSSGDLVPLTAGVRMEGVLGAISLDNFSELSEALQEDVIELVNRASRIIHSEVARQGGVPYRNTGDAFYIMWPLDNEEQTQSDSDIADSAVTAVIKLEEALVSSQTLRQTLSALRLRGKTGGGLTIHSALHRGTAIGGSIGSVQKVTATYISKDVERTRCIRDLGSFYDVSFLISDAVYDSMSLEKKSECLPVDRVLLPGSKTSTVLYGVHCHPFDRELFRPYTPNAWDQRVQHMTSAVPARVTVDELQTNFVRGQWEGLYRQGMTEYLRGGWKKAHKVLTEAAAVRADFRPLALALKYMEERDIKVPSHWRFGGRRVE